MKCNSKNHGSNQKPKMEYRNGSQPHLKCIHCTLVNAYIEMMNYFFERKQSFPMLFICLFHDKIRSYSIFCNFTRKRTDEDSIIRKHNSQIRGEENQCILIQVQTKHKSFVLMAKAYYLLRSRIPIS